MSSCFVFALLTRSTSPFQGAIITPEFVDSFQPGILAIPFVVINIILLGISTVYHKKKNASTDQ